MTIETKTIDTWTCDTCGKKEERLKGLKKPSWITIMQPWAGAYVTEKQIYCTQYCAIKSFGRTPGGLQEMQKVLNNKAKRPS